MITGQTYFDMSFFSPIFILFGHVPKFLGRCVKPSNYCDEKQYHFAGTKYIIEVTDAFEGKQTVKLLKQKYMFHF